MIPLRDEPRRQIPWVTWAVFVVNVVIYLWDRQWRLTGSNVVFADLAMRPLDVVTAATERGDLFPIGTIYTSMFLHGNLLHLVGNMVFLLAFGGTIEEAFGSLRFAIYFLFWGVAAAVVHIYVDPASSVPVLGASGAIGGILGAYLLLFPAHRFQVFVPFLPFLSFTMSAWVLLGLWFLGQVLIPAEGVANWAHVGGFVAGMFTVLAAGGRDMVLSDLDPLPSERRR